MSYNSSVFREFVFQKKRVKNPDCSAAQVTVVEICDDYNKVICWQTPQI